MTDEKYCSRCQGAGQVDTGIMESPVTICNDCNGTGLAQQRAWVGLTDEEKKNIFLKWYGKHWAYTEQVQSVMDSVEAKLKEKNT
jgi:DnaJ-class molecular chaperone